jgi:hypothetical protein
MKIFDFSLLFSNFIYLVYPHYPLITFLAFVYPQNYIATFPIVLLTMVTLHKNAP